jgi:Zn-dependent protease
MLFNRSLAEIIATAIVALIAMTVHEYAHARVAYEMGDNSAYSMGKMTLDPRANINWFGFLMFVFVGFGVLGQVVVDETRMGRPRAKTLAATPLSNPRWGMLAAVAAGPFSNLLLAALFALPFWFNLVDPAFPRSRDILPTIPMILTIGVYFNVLLFVFNLIPLAPLDGWTIVQKLLPRDLAYTWTRYYKESSYLLLIIIFADLFLNLGIMSRLIGVPVQELLRLFLRF